MAKSIKVIVILIVLYLVPSNVHSIEYTVCQSVSAVCLHPCCLPPNSYACYGCLIGDDAYWFIPTYQSCPESFDPTSYCQSHNCLWDTLPPCGRNFYGCDPPIGCPEGKLWALCGYENTCNPDASFSYGGNCKIYDSTSGQAQDFGTLSGSCTASSYHGYGCDITYTTCFYDPITPDLPDGDCAMFCPPGKVPDNDCANCICPIQTLEEAPECPNDMYFDFVNCACLCKPVDLWADNFNAIYSCSDKTLTVTSDNGLSNYLEVYLELYRCRGQGGGGSDVSEWLCPSAYAESCSGGWDYITDTWSGLHTGVNNIELEKGLYRLVFYIYRSYDCCNYDCQRYTEVFFNVGCGCTFDFKNEKIEALKEKLKTVFPFSLLIWADSFFDFQSGNNSTMVLGLPVIGSVEVQFIDLHWFRTLLLAFIVMSVIGHIMRKIL